MARGADRSTSPRALQRSASREALLRAAREIAAEGGDPLDPAAVAAKAGVSRPLWYRYFPSRADFVEALLGSIHAAPPAAPAVDSGPPAPEILGFFVALAEGLDAQAPLARALIPASHLPGPVSDARARRREAAIERVAGMLPAGGTRALARAAFLMDAFLGMQLAWSKGQVPGRLADRVREELPWAIAGVGGAPPASRTPSATTRPPQEDDR